MAPWLYQENLAGACFHVHLLPPHLLGEEGHFRTEQAREEIEIALAEVVVALPKVEGGGEVALDVLPKRASVVVGSKYRLKLPLPYAVDHKRVKAKWKGKAKKLKVTLRAAVAL